jgi:hypothetical protein
MADQGVDEVAAELYSVPPAQFVAARDEAVRLARKGGDRDLAGRIGRLRRPTMSAWAVNILVRAAGPQIDDMLALGEELRAAQQQLQGEQLRRLNQRRRETIGTLARRAAQLAAEAGHSLNSAAVVEVEQTLVAALFDPECAEAVRGGRLTKALQHIGMGAQPLLPPGLELAGPSRSSGNGGSAPVDRSAPQEPEPAPRSPAEPDRASEGAGSEGAGSGRASSGRAGSERPAAEVPALEDEVARRRRRRELRRERELQRATIELEQAGTRLERAEQEARQAAERSALAERRLAELRLERDKAVQERDEAQRRARSAARVRDDAKRRVQRLTEQDESP